MDGSSVGNIFKTGGDPTNIFYFSAMGLDVLPLLYIVEEN
jgi:hypothetical protein